MLVGCLFVAPLVFGGRHDMGRLVYAGVVAFGAAATLARSRRPVVGRLGWPAAVVMAGAVALVGLQLAPLPPGVLSALAPSHAELLPAWSVAGAEPGLLGQWRTLSLTPYGTRIGLAVLLAHATLFWVTAGALQSREDIARLLRWIAIAAAVMAAFGLLQHATSNGKLLWLFEHPNRAIGESVQGPFANKNHFGHFVVLGMAPLLWAAVVAAAGPGRRNRGWRSRAAGPQALAWAAGTLLAVTAVLLTLSRGAALGLAVCLAAASLLAWRARLVDGRRLAGWGIVGCALLIGALSIHGYDRVASRLDDLTSGSLDELDQSHGRRWIWEANLSALAASPWVGYGVGSHRDVYPIYFDHPYPTHFTHCESGYLHLATEAGATALLLAGAALAIVGWWCWVGWRASTEPDDRALWAMIVPGLAASLVHSLVDFVWFIPACFCVTVLLAGAALRLAQMQATWPAAAEAPARPGADRSLAWAPALAALLAVAMLVRPAWASIAWDRYVRDSVACRHLTDRASPAGVVNATVQSTERLLLDRMIVSLEETVARSPGHARAHARLAGRLLSRFELRGVNAPNPMGLGPLSDAAIASQFTSHSETVSWLRRAFPAGAEDLVRCHRHAVAAVRGCPLDGESYQLLEALRFLDPPALRDADLLDRQARRVRPFDGEVLFNAGRRRLMAGDTEAACELWREALRRPGSHCEDVVSLLCGRLPAAEFLEVFQPDWGILKTVLQSFAEVGGPEDRVALADYALQAARREVPETSRRRAALLWVEASQAARRAERPDQAVHCASEAVRLEPGRYDARSSLVVAFVASDRLAEADPHVRWCLTRRPDDPYMQAQLRRIAKRRLTRRGTPPGATTK